MFKWTLQLITNGHDTLFTPVQVKVVNRETTWGKKNSRIFLSLFFHPAQTNFCNWLFSFSKFAPFVFVPRNKKNETEDRGPQNQKPNNQNTHSHSHNHRLREIDRWSVAWALAKPFAPSATKISNLSLKISKPFPSAAMSSTSYGQSLSLSELKIENSECVKLTLLFWNPSLQQWFEYCSSAKKCSCPVCKQSCSASNVNRLYFQSVGDSNDLILSQNVEDEDPRELRGQVQRLEVKVKGLSSLLERQGKELKDVNDQVNSIAFWILKILVSFPVLKKLGLVFHYFILFFVDFVCLWLVFG